MSSSVHHHAQVEEDDQRLVIVKKQKPSFRAVIRNALLEMFPTNPSAEVEDVHEGGWAIPIVLITKIAFVAILIYYTVANTEKEVSKKFLSLSPTSDAQICTPVPNPLTATFLGDLWGHWQSSASYVQSGGFYKLVLSGSEIDNPTYTAAMMKFRSNLEIVGEKSKRRGFAFSLIALASWQVENVLTRMKLATNAQATLMMANFPLVSAGVYAATGQARNVPGAAGGGVSGYSFYMSPDNKYINFEFPLSQCTQASQEAMVTNNKIMSFAGSMQGTTLTVSHAAASFHGDTLNQPYVANTNPLNVIVSQGKVSDDMLLSFTDESDASDPKTYPNQDGTYKLTDCKVGTTPGPITIAGTCNMVWTPTGTPANAPASVTLEYGTLVTATSSLSSMTADLPSNAVIAGEGISTGIMTTNDGCLTGSNFATVTGYSGTGGTSSTSDTLTVTATSSGALVNGMTITFASLTVTISSCSITSGVGTCTMASAQTIAVGTTITGTTANTCASAVGGTAGSGTSVLLQSTTSGSFTINRAQSTDTIQMMALGSAITDCTHARKGVPGYFDSLYFSPKYNFGFTNRAGHNTLSVSFDVNSVYTALAVNYGIVPVDALVRVNVSNPQALDLDPRSAFYVDDNNLPMDPVLCVASATCLVVVRNTYFYPIFFPFDNEAGQPCKCASAGVPDESGSSPYVCKISPTLVLGLVMFPDPTPGDEEGNEKLVAFARAMNKRFIESGGESGDGDFALRDWFGPSVTAIFNNEYDDDVSPPKISGFEDMCDAAGVGHKNCVMFMASFEVNPDQFLSLNALNLQFTALQSKTQLYSQPLISQPANKFYSITCTNMISLPDTMLKLSKTPPVSLIQPYQKCQSTLLTAIPAALGAAAGSAALYSGVLLSLLLAIALSYINGRLERSKRDKVLPPLQKAKKERRDLAQSLKSLQTCIPKIIRELPIDAARKEELVRDFVDNYRSLSVTEERVPLQQAQLLKMEVVGSGGTEIDSGGWKATTSKEP